MCAQTLMDNLEYFTNTDLIFNNNSTWLGEDTPCVVYGTRGRMRVELTGTRRAVPRARGRSLWACRPSLDMAAPHSVVS
jgi:hypothetical protein